MAQRVNVRTSGRGGRFYIDKSGDRYWSVTTLLKGVPKDALMYWTAKEAAICAVDEIGYVYSMLGSKDDPPKRRAARREQAIRYIKDACWRSSGAKMELGSLIHEVIEALVLDQPMPDIPPEAESYIDQFMAFVDEWKPDFEASELTVYNRTQKYAGTLDLIARVRDALPEPAPEVATLLIDTKTGKCPADSSDNCVGAYSDTALQLAAYRHAEFLELRDGTEVEMPATDGAAVLHLAPDHYSLVPMRTDEEVFKVVLWAREIYRWLQETSKDAVGQPRIAGRAPAVTR